MAQLVVDPIAICTFVHKGFPNMNSGSQTDVAVDDSQTSIFAIARTRRGLMRADISSIAGETINSTSKLEVYVSVAYGATAQTIHRITQGAWTEMGATWNKYDGINAWATPGGDFSTPTVPYTSPSATGWFTITGADLAAFLQDALDNRAGIVDMLLKCDTEPQGPAKGFLFNSDDAASNKPKLTVDYGVVAARHNRLLFGQGR